MCTIEERNHHKRSNIQSFICAINNLLEDQLALILTADLEFACATTRHQTVDTRIDKMVDVFIKGRKVDEAVGLD